MDGLYEQFRIALHQVWRRRWLAMAVAWAVALVGWLVIALIPNSYEAKARLFVQMQSILPNQVGITPDERQNQLLLMVGALRSPRGFAGSLHRWQQQGDQHTDARDHHEQLDERKADQP